MEQVGQFRSKGVIIDVTALDVMDSFAVRTLRTIAHMLPICAGRKSSSLASNRRSPSPWCSWG